MRVNNTSLSYKEDYKHKKKEDEQLKQLFYLDTHFLTPVRLDQG